MVGTIEGCGGFPKEFYDFVFVMTSIDESVEEGFSDVCEVVFVGVLIPVFA